MIKRVVSAVCVSLAVLFLSGCVHTARFDGRALENAIDLKVESLAVMDRATEPYSNHVARVEDLKLGLEKAMEYARWIPNNEYTVAQWELLASPTNNLLGGFLVKWEAKSSLSPALVRGKKKQVVRAFDEMIRLESGKIQE